MIPFLVKQQLAKQISDIDKLPVECDALLTGDAAWNGSEHDLQKKFFAWLSSLLEQNPMLWLAHAIPNGGTRNKIEAAKLKAEGVRSGVPDVFLPIPKKSYHGLYIEFKAGKNKPSTDQLFFINCLHYLGYKCIVTNSFKFATSITVQYIQ